MPQTPRLSAAYGVCRAPSCRSSSARPGTSRVQTASVASGVMSRGASPVPPVVSTRAARLAASRRAGIRRSSSSGSTSVSSSCAPASVRRRAHGRSGEVRLRTGKAAVADGQDDSGAAGESSGGRHISRIDADARNRAEDEKIERPASFWVWRFAAAGATFTVAHPSQTNEPMPTTPPQIDPESSPTQPETPQSGSGSNDTGTAAPKGRVSVVPHEVESGTVVAPVRIRTNRYGELEEHELVHLLDTIEDERARARFRESIYISLFIWLAIAWVAFYGPKYLWHAPQLITPTTALQQQALVQLNAPRLPHHAVAPPPKIDRGTLAKLRAMEPKPLPTPAAPAQPTPPVATQPTQPVPSPALPMPVAPHPAPPRTAAPVPDSALAAAPTQPSFNTPATAGQDMQQAMRGSQSAGDNRSMGISGGGRGRAQAGAGCRYSFGHAGCQLPALSAAHYARDLRAVDPAASGRDTAAAEQAGHDA